VVAVDTGEEEEQQFLVSSWVVVVGVGVVPSSFLPPKSYAMYGVAQMQTTQTG